MPSGPPELHAKWCGFYGDPNGSGDLNAMHFLKMKGWTLNRGWTWTKPHPEHEPSGEENEAINYLIWEWDFGGVDGVQAPRKGVK